ncbi:hypothetical protein HYU50_05515 [Candidatus Woesearchaeota archaeon]|nr:hypothetical protein [Candidatus Woesearchaeota archaeon]
MKTTFVTRHTKDGNVVALIIKYNVPCPPIQVYKVENGKLVRILPGWPELKPFRKAKQDCGELESAMLRQGRRQLEKKDPYMEITDITEKFNPGDYITNIHGEYEF